MPKNKNNKKVVKQELIRLNKFLSHNSIYSRREADKLIQKGRVTILNETVTNLATRVDKNSIIKIDGKVIKADENRMYTVIVYNKPKGELVTKNDPQGRKTIYDTLSKKYMHYLPIGRLDYSSEGVLLLSDSIEITNALMHSNLERVYKLKVDGEINYKVEHAMKEGLELKDATRGGHEKSKIKSMTFAPFIAYKIISSNSNFSKIKVVINEGKNRELRRFFSYFGLNVMDLKRLDFGGISLNNLPTGKSRFLNKEEYRSLRKYLNSVDND